MPGRTGAGRDGAGSPGRERHPRVTTIKLGDAELRRVLKTIRDDLQAPEVPVGGALCSRSWNESKSTATK